MRRRTCLFVCGRVSGCGCVCALVLVCLCGCVRALACVCVCVWVSARAPGRTPVMGQVVVNMSSMKVGPRLVKLKRVHPQK